MSDSKPASAQQVGGQHYKDWPIQPAEFCQKNKLPWCEANVIKYVCRHRQKNGREDIEKAIHYLKLLLEWGIPRKREPMNDSDTICPRCDGCGKIANTDDGEPWSLWQDLPVKSAMGVMSGLVKPVVCPDCNGTGERPQVTLTKRSDSDLLTGRLEEIDDRLEQLECPIQRSSALVSKCGTDVKISCESQEDSDKVFEWLLPIFGDVES